MRSARAKVRRVAAAACTRRGKELSRNFSRTAAAAALALWLPGHAFAADAGGAFAVRGAGTAPCAKFTKDKASDSRDFYVFAGWLDGYLSATNQMRPETFDLAPWQTTELLLRLLDDYCARNPEVGFALAARRLSEALDGEKLAATSELRRVEHKGRFTLIYAEVLKRVQERLRQLKFYAGPADGAFGPQTREAIERFQAERKFEATGLPDQRTLAALLGAPAK